MHAPTQPILSLCHLAVVPLALQRGIIRPPIPQAMPHRNHDAVGPLALQRLGVPQVQGRPERRALEVLPREYDEPLPHLRAGPKKPRQYVVLEKSCTIIHTPVPAGVPARRQDPQLGAEPPSLGETLANFFQDPLRKGVVLVRIPTMDNLLASPGVPAGQQDPKPGAKPPSLGETLANFFRDPLRKVREVVQFSVKNDRIAVSQLVAEVLKHHNSPSKTVTHQLRACTQFHRLHQFWGWRVWREKGTR